MGSYHKHLTNASDCFLSHLHHTTLDTIAFWNLQWTTGAMGVLQHRNEFRFFDFVKWLVACNDPLRKVLLKLFLIPRSLLKAASDAGQVNEERHYLTLAWACWSLNAFLMFSDVPSSFLTKSDPLFQSSFFLPDAYAIS